MLVVSLKNKLDYITIINSVKFFAFRQIGGQKDKIFVSPRPCTRPRKLRQRAETVDRPGNKRMGTDIITMHARDRRSSPDFCPFMRIIQQVPQFPDQFRKLKIIPKKDVAVQTLVVAFLGGDNQPNGKILKIINLKDFYV